MFKFNRSTKSLTRPTVTTSTDVAKELPENADDRVAACTRTQATSSEEISHSHARVRIRIIIDVSTLDLNAKSSEEEVEGRRDDPHSTYYGNSGGFDAAATVIRRVTARILSSPWISDYLSRKLRGRGDSDEDEYTTRVYVEIQPVGFENRKSKESNYDGNGQFMELAEPSTSSFQRPSCYLTTTPDLSASSAATPPTSDRSSTPTIVLLALKAPTHIALSSNKKGIASLVLSSAWSFVLQSREPWMGGENTVRPHGCAQSRPHYSLLVVASEDAAFARVVAERARRWWPFTREGDRVIDTVSVHLMPTTAVTRAECDDFAMVHDIPTTSFECSYSVGSFLKEWGLRPLRLPIKNGEPRGETRSPRYWGSLREREDGEKIKRNALSEKRSNVSAEGDADATSAGKGSVPCTKRRLPQLVIAVDCAQFAKLSDDQSDIAKRVVERCAEIVKSVLTSSQVRDGTIIPRQAQRLEVEIALFDTVSARGDSVMPTLMAFETAARDLGPQRFNTESMEVRDNEESSIFEGEFVFQTSRALSRLRIAGTESGASRVSCGGGSLFQQAVVDAELMCYLAERLIYSPVGWAQFSSVIPPKVEGMCGSVKASTVRQHFILASGDGDFVEAVRYLLSTEASLVVSGDTLIPCNRSCSVLYLKASASGAWSKKENLSLVPL